MIRKKASDYDQRVLNLFDKLVHGDIDRREFITRASQFTAGTAAAAALLDSLLPRYALAEQVAPDDPRISAEMISYESPDGNGTIRGLLAQPAGAIGPRGGVLVVHENRGLNPYIEDVARRLAVAGYIALAPDGLSPLGGYPGTDEEGREMQGQLDGDKLFEDFVAGVGHLDSMDSVGKLGAVGFCYGGGVCNGLAVRLPGLAASVPFYGSPPALEDVGQIQAALQIHHAEMDERLMGSWPDYEAALKANGINYEAYVYAGAQHGFHNDTTPRYDEAAATLAWERTLSFFAEHLAA